MRRPTTRTVNPEVAGSSPVEPAINHEVKRGDDLSPPLTSPELSLSNVLRPRQRSTRRVKAGSTDVTARWPPPERRCHRPRPDLVVTRTPYISVPTIPPSLGPTALVKVSFTSGDEESDDTALLKLSFTALAVAGSTFLLPRQFASR